MGGNRLIETKVINLFGAPGAGKTTLAAMIFAEMKQRHINCELVTEFAKKAVWEKRDLAMQNEILLFANKHHELHVLTGQVEYIILDSPLLLTVVYNTLYGQVANLNSLAESEHERFDNINLFIINNSSEHSMDGRVHDEKEVKRIEEKLTQLYYSMEHTSELLTTESFDVKEIVDSILGGKY